MNITDKNLKVLNITHFDMDGACCHIILKNYYKSVTALPITYQSEKTLFAKATEEINKEHYDLIICTDFYPEIAYKDLTTLKVPMIVLDHHESAEKFHNGKTIVINTQNSASKLVFDLYNKLSDLSHLEDLVNIVDDFDMYKKKTGKFLFAEFGEKDPDENAPQAINVNEVVKADFPKAETVEVDDSEMFASNPKDKPEETAEELDNDDFFARLSQGEYLRKFD